MSRGRAYPIIKRSSHIALTLGELKSTNVIVKKEVKKEEKIVKTVEKKEVKTKKAVKKTK